MRINLKYEPLPENAKLFAKDIVDAAREVSKVKLDYSPKSLKRVEKIIEGFRKDGVKKEEIAGTLFGFGCYLGEVFVRQNGATWKVASETAMKNVTSMPILIELPDGQVGNPIGKVFKQFEAGRSESISYFYKVFSVHRKS